MNCTRCKTRTDRPDAHGLCLACHDSANARYAVTGDYLGKPLVWQIEHGFVSWQEVVKSLEKRESELRERVDGAIRNVRAYRDGLVEAHDVIRRIENVLTVPHVHPSHMPSIDPENDEVSNGPSSPLTGADLAEKYGFEPVPDWKKDPFVRPMRIMVDGFAPNGQEPNNRVAYLCVQCQKVVPENAPCPHCSDAERLAALPSEGDGGPK